VKYSKAQIHRRVYSFPELRFEDQRLSSFSGLVVIQALLKKLNLRVRLKGCFQHIQSSAITGFHVITVLLILHLMLGYRRLREMERYADDPMVLSYENNKRLDFKGIPCSAG